MERQTVLITGAAGFIGSHAADALLRHGWRVVGVDNFCDFYPRNIKERNLKCINAGRGIDVEEIDITDGAAIERVMSKLKPAAVLHLAAMAGVRPSIERPALYARVNIEGTTNLLESARRHGVAKFVFASSSSVYGNGARVPFSEEDSVAQPISPYAASKRAAELMCYCYWQLYRLPTFCLRLFTVYGPRQRPDLAIHKFTRLIVDGKPIPLFGDGQTSRDYTYVDDTVSGILAALDRCDRYRVYNLGGSNPVTLKQLISGLERAIGKPAKLDRQPAQAGDVERTCADLTRSREELGYQPHVGLDEGLQRFVEWFAESRAGDALPP